ncbi:hypothetical protein [Chelativorans multitrophicus]|uniref:hypothetical protein n=1 Tax=Chelativorans multitrophicus TaxID=449973 RepID=UPI00140A1027|nr:hypothetical protein [Chelativorans multitrophicus]
MSKRLILAIGVLLNANDYYIRIYDFPDDTPVKYCFSMDKIGIYGCFHNAAAPMLFAWVPFLIG